MAEYVDKNDVYRAAREYVKGEGLLGVVALAIFEAAIDKLPAEDVEYARHGKWEDYDGKGQLVCTSCRSVVSESYRYCPWCGASMERRT